MCERTFHLSRNRPGPAARHRSCNKSGQATKSLRYFFFLAFFFVAFFLAVFFFAFFFAISCHLLLAD
jgi:hypothetical protein